LDWLSFPDDPGPSTFIVTVYPFCAAGEIPVLVTARRFPPGIKRNGTRQVLPKPGTQHQGYSRKSMNSIACVFFQSGTGFA
jgi:hypothetical protein